jgi:ApbE superfamily uncharacterized protein (UPF0280 family)
LIALLQDDSVLVDVGPMTMVIRAEANGKSLPEWAEAGANEGLRALTEVASFKKLLFRRVCGIKEDASFPQVVNRMVDATRAMKDSSLTPMAAVAGSISDEVADFLFHRRDITKVVVNNGGDIAVRLRGNDSVTVGGKVGLEESGLSYTLAIVGNDGVGGVATSGLGGRSFTKGIASAAMVLASSAALADAAATVLGNATNVSDARIERRLAGELDPDTDIFDELVTVKAGDLEEEKIEEALHNGLAEASRLQKEGEILGALLVVKGRWVKTGWLSEKGVSPCQSKLFDKEIGSININDKKTVSLK